jgi:hypothetical protein
VWSGVQQTLLSDATQVSVAQNKLVVMCFVFMPLSQAVIVEQDAWAEQQSSLLSSLFGAIVFHFLGSLKWPFGQLKWLTALHLVGSIMQHMASSDAVHVPVAQ